MRRHGYLSPRRRFVRGGPGPRRPSISSELDRRKRDLCALQQRRGLLPAECSELLDILHLERAS